MDGANRPDPRTKGTSTMDTYTCPTNPLQPNGEPHTIIGCGRSFEAVPDDEGIIDCPHCGMFWHPAGERIEQGEAGQ
jgi:hypothetical protein